MSTFQQSVQSIQSENNPALSLNDSADMCVLGILYDDARSYAGLIKCISQMETGSWHPTMDVVDGALMRLISAHYVVEFDYVGGSAFSITPLGMRRLFELLRTPLPETPHQRSNVVEMKSCFVETVPETVSTSIIRELIGYYTCQLQGLKECCGDCPFGVTRQQLRNNRELAQIAGALDWLRGLTADRVVN